MRSRVPIVHRSVGEKLAGGDTDNMNIIRSQSSYQCVAVLRTDTGSDFFWLNVGTVEHLLINDWFIEITLRYDDVFMLLSV